MSVAFLGLTSIVLVVLLGVIVALASYAIYSAGKKTQDSLMIQIEAAKAKKNSHLMTIPYADLLGIINNLINFYVKSAVLEFPLTTKTQTELSVLMDDILIQICTNVRMAMSEDIQEAMTSYVTEAHMMQYIKNTTRLILLSETTKIEKQNLQHTTQDTTSSNTEEKK